MIKRRWFRPVLVAIALLVAASWGVSGALEYGWARRSLLARLSASFGRPVEAGGFSFSLLRGPRLEVNSVTVAEDPRFGQEYFLRADQLTVGLQWMALLRGRVEFGALLLTHPSLNLVHTADGHWNVESWLPPAANAPAVGHGQPTSAAMPAAPVPVLARHLGRIEIDDGRINFKLGTEKMLFALVNVSGQLDQDGAGRWSLDLQAIPMRASVELQEAGTLRLRGTVAGTSLRLRPASLNLTWEDASLADALRLASGRDYSVRGLLGAELSATIKDEPAPDRSASRLENKTQGKTQEVVASRGGESTVGNWNIAGKLRLSGIHRWDLAARATDPAVNLSVAAAWSPGTPQIDVARCVVESAHSQLIANGDVDWSHGFDPTLRIASSRIALEDLLAWRRSFRPNLPDDLKMDGAIGLQAVLGEWPPRIQQATIEGTGVVVHLAALGTPIVIGPISAALRRDSLVLDPVSVTLPGQPTAIARARPSGTIEAAPGPAGMLRVEGALGPFRPSASPLDWEYRVAVSGQTARAQDFATIAASFGRSANADWTVAGTAALQLTWAGVVRRAELLPSGKLDLRGLQLNSVMLNQPLVLSSASVELHPNDRHISLGDAQAFGAHWKGTIDQRTADGVWHFDLSAPHLDIADLDLWLGPRARPGFLARMLPFASSGPPPAREVVFGGLAANGRLRVAELLLAPLHLEKLDAVVDISGHNLVLQHAQAELFDGRVTGNLSAQISADPAYSFHGQFERVNLAALASATSSLAGHFAGLASGEIVLAARGIGRDSLLGSLAGQGTMQVREPVLRGLDLFSAAGPGDAKFAADSRFSAANASFHVSGGGVQVDQLSLAAREGRFEIKGSVNLSRELDLRVWSLPRGVEVSSDINPGANHLGTNREDWIIGGTLDAPQLTRQTHIAGNPEVTLSAPSRR